MATQHGEPIAIVGSGCRFPGGSTNPSRLWDLLREPRDCLTEIPSDRFNWKGFYGGEKPHHGTTRTKHGYFLNENISKFDPHFFNIQPAEADLMDPQQRLLLETIYKSLESGGLTLEGLQGSSTAVFVGMMGCDYADIVLRDLDCAQAYAGSGSARSIHSNRISYFFDWHGPSMAIDTACSSSMMAIHLAVQALRSGESKLAVAGGASLNMGPENFVVLSQLNMLAPDGRSKMWDASANGYARGEGVAAVVLKPLRSAIADGDHIECIIRETGINQDGRTKGLTTPSETSQAELIRRTYERAGLDIRQKKDRPQYFEAHGTGTPVGDPKEAEAVNNAFFPAGCDYGEEDTIFIGSIKTVIGHTEGAAGIAGILKASLALQNKSIPPNLLFNKLSATVEPFAKHLKVPISLLSWPAVPEGCPRRASVNSFGFGGSNGHAILESWDNNRESSKNSQSSPIFTPFIFSAASERSLIGLLKVNKQYLEQNKTTNLRDFAWTLHHRTSTLPFKTTISAQTIEELCFKLAEKIQGGESKEKIPVGIKVQSKPKSRILGVFTGQGAQWPGMGRELIQTSAQVRKIINDLDKSLSGLPIEHRPDWSIAEELLKDSGSSRIGEAEISQPLCTAIQIILVDILWIAGIEFKAIIGHSSGEIGAAYAAKIINASDAIRIAYYRGIYARLAAGPSGKKGGMLAVGTSMEDALEFCQLPDFEGRLSVAACNSSASVTLSGDLDAIEEAKLVFEDEKKFTRLLKVDTAYHSHHMDPCSQPYLDALDSCNISVSEPDHDSPIWFSSVYNGKRVETSDKLRSNYWRNNMIQTVLFSKALESAISEVGPFDMALEIGPHPALKGPATQTFHDIASTNCPYTGFLSRGQSDIDSLSSALGYMWTHLGQKSVNFASFDQLITKETKPVFLRDRPTYPWDHERSFWYEPRMSIAHRFRNGPLHDLLGVKSGESTATDAKWRNFLIPNEIAWLTDHQLQGQPVYPAAAYAAMAWEAAISLAGDRSVQLVEVQDLTIGRAITFNDDKTGVEVHFALANIEFSNKDLPETFHADWTCHSCPNKESGVLVLVSSGKVLLTFGEQRNTILPPRLPRQSNMIETDTNDFYAAMSAVGYGYTGSFRAMTSMQRKMNHSSGTFSMPTSKMLMHPALLDVAFQAFFAAFSYPGDGGLYSLHMPNSINRISINPYYFQETEELQLKLLFDATLAKRLTGETFGDVQIYSQDSEHAIMHVDGFSSVPFTKATAADDRNIYSELVWDVACPNGEAVINSHRATSKEIQLGYDCERVAHFYLRKLHEAISSNEYCDLKWNFQRILDFAAHVVSQVRTGKHPHGNQEWCSDTEEQILAIIERYPNVIDFQIMKAVGESYLSVVREESTALEHLTRNNMLYDVYSNGLGFDRVNTWTASMIKQISHRYPHMKIMEIGAGTGGATKKILDQLGQAVSTYTYTDISPAFFEKAQERFKNFANKMVFKTFDMEKDSETQGFTNESFDLIVASNVIHTTGKMEEVMKQVRQLLKPGGHLVLLEITDNSPTRMGFIMGGLPGWWIGHDDGRQWGPTLRPAQWESLLNKTGFSGIDAIATSIDTLPYPFSVMASQAVDDRVNFLRQPFSSQEVKNKLGDLMIIGGKNLQVSKLINDVSRILSGRFQNITVFESLEELKIQDTPMAGNILCVTDLDEPVFKNIDASQLTVLKCMFGNARNMVWVTLVGDPYANMSVGLGRSLCCEYHELKLQIISFEHPNRPDPSLLSESLVRLCITETWESNGRLDNLLWSIEPELRIQAGRQLIPRMYESRTQNDRYNSERRAITIEKSPETAKIAVFANGNSYDLRESSSASTFNDISGEDFITINVTRSLLSAIKIRKVGYLFLSIGTVADTKENIVALSSANCSIITVPRAFTHRVETSPEDPVRYLASVAAGIVAQNIIAMVSPRGKLLVYGAEPLLFSSIIKNAEKAGKQVFELTNQPTTAPASLFIHTQALENSIKATLPSDISVFLNMSAKTNDIQFCGRVAQALPADCKVKKSRSLFSTDSSSSFQFLDCTDRIKNLLKLACSDASTLLGDNHLATVNLVAVKDITQVTVNSALTVIDWTADERIPVTVQPIDSKISFSAEKTYLLIGLTADLGQSLCEWFVRHGARSVVITSRNPRVDQSWLDNFTPVGAAVKVFSMDITDKKSLCLVHDEIKRTLPPIGGVANAAMVLQDIMFSNMDIDDLLPVLKPKVDGSKHLDDLFSDTPLDFFILFSSLAFVAGNKGQSSYTAANGFMTGLVEQRRKHGLCASIMHIGPIIGIGYITRTDQMSSKAVQAYGAYPISESDFLQIFGEAVLASPADSGLNPEIITGLRPIDPVVDHVVSWRANPKFSHFWLDQEEAQEGMKTMKTVTSAKSQLLEATSVEQAREIIQVSFTAKLIALLQLPLEDMDEQVPLTELGVDSLVAVEVRSWFKKELGIEVPVMKVLGGASVSGLIADASESIPSDLVPRMKEYVSIQK